VQKPAVTIADSHQSVIYLLNTLYLTTLNNYW